MPYNNKSYTPTISKIHRTAWQPALRLSADMMICAHLVSRGRSALTHNMQPHFVTNEIQVIIHSRTRYTLVEVYGTEK